MKMCELTLPAIQENYYKFDKFYHKRFERTCKKYTAQNFNDISIDENITASYVEVIRSFALMSLKASMMDISQIMIV